MGYSIQIKESVLQKALSGRRIQSVREPASYITLFRPDLKYRAKHRLKALRVENDAMYPRIPKNSIVVVAPTTEYLWIPHNVDMVLYSSLDNKYFPTL